MGGSRWAPRAGAVVGQYSLSEVVARGSAASIWRATPMAEAACAEDVAIKCISGRRVRRGLIENEVGTLSLACSHPNIVSLLEVVAVGEWTCLVMTLASGTALGPDLEQALSSSGGKLSEANARGFFRQILLAVAHCHSRGLYHGDLKMENVLLQQRPGTPDPILWLCDFGCATMCSTRTETVGTANYVAPEAVEDDARYDSGKADMFSLGVLLYTMLTGHFPFARPPLSALNSRATRDAVMSAYVDGDPATLCFPPGVSPEAASIVRALLQRDPAARPCAATVAADTWLVQEGIPPHPSAAARIRPGALAVASSSLRRQTEPDHCADTSKVSAVSLCTPDASPQHELVCGDVVRCGCHGPLRPRTLSLPVRLVSPRCDNRIALGGCTSSPCDPCC